MKLAWGALMRLGLGRLGLAPADFWTLTPAELFLMAGLEGRAPMGRAALEGLAALYPDGETGTRKEMADGGNRE